ncbi:hypothetical protein C6I21_12500 [Alkalicoccus urumqiensis]|uniref:CvpA family protein n=1 Tax=Alkalicoccus urumqiensis TaxID=1548213 RepID=A0A2P6MFC7_ALKUR|nr:hypothetical protein C6I21_12500 [Alkalicoccus urumqiensis]
MVSAVILFFLFLSLMVGYRRGFLLQAVHIAGLLLAFTAAWLYFEQLGSMLQLWIPFPVLDESSPLNVLDDAIATETAFYNGVAFVLIFIVVKIIAQIIGSMFDFLGNLPIISFFNSILGSALGLVEGLVITAVLLHLAALIQVDIVQELLQSSSIAEWIFYYTPIVSEELRTLWSEGTQS